MKSEWLERSTMLALTTGVSLFGRICSQQIDQTSFAFFGQAVNSVMKQITAVLNSSLH